MLCNQAYNGSEIVRAARWMPEVAAAIRGGAPPPLPWAPEGVIKGEY